MLDNFAKLLIAGSLIGTSFYSPAYSQVTIDVAKVTCEQLLDGPDEATVLTAVWLSGYFNGKRAKSIVDIKQFKRNAEAVAKLCTAAPNQPAMQVIEAVLSGAKN